MARSLLLSCCLALAGLSSVSVTFGQDNLLDELYGRGVHAYYSHDYTSAYSALSEAVVSGSKDPRVYYFRALSETKLGRPDEATEDFRMGAMLEVSSGGVYNVGRSIERVQGAERLELEKYRRQARLTVRNKAQDLAKQRYEQRKLDETKVLRGGPTTKPAVAPPVPADADPTDPYGDGAVPSTTTPKPATTTKPATKPAETKPAAKPAVDDAFAPEPADEMPAEEKPAEETPADEKPAEEMPADEKPADETPAEEKPADEMPAEEKPAEDVPADEMPADEKPAKPPVKPADDDPFGAAPAPGGKKPVVAQAAQSGASNSTVKSLVRAVLRGVAGGSEARPTAPPAVAVQPAEVPEAEPITTTVEPAEADAETDPFGDDALQAQPNAVKPASATKEIPAEAKPAAVEADDPFGN